VRILDPNKISLVKIEKLPAQLLYLRTPNDEAAARVVAAGGGVQAVIDATGLGTRENVLNLIDPVILKQAFDNDARKQPSPRGRGRPRGSCRRPGARQGFAGRRSSRFCHGRARAARAVAFRWPLRIASLRFVSPGRAVCSSAASRALHITAAALEHLPTVLDMDDEDHLPDAAKTDCVSVKITAHANWAISLPQRA
jgi:hypothetical protein